MQGQQDVLEQFILKLLADNGLGNITDDQRAIYVPKLLSQLEQRIGIELMPKLSEPHLDKFSALIDDTQTTPETWQAFWHEAVPDFEQALQDIMEEFAADVSEQLAA